MGELLLDLAIKGTLTLLATGGIVALFRGAPAATRHAVWTMGMASALALPVLSQLLPGWSLALLPAAAPAGPAVGTDRAAGADWGVWLALAWAAGGAIVLAGVVLGRFRVWWIARRSAEIDHGELPALATALCGEMAISRRVSVRLCPDPVMPMVWGVARPVILLPAEATSWAPGLRRDVLLHELAHVRRHDYLNQLVTRLACAVHWFNPLVWVAARRLRAERERACDDHVLETGASACDYAEHLVDVARRMRPMERGTLGVTMAGRSAFVERVAALLDARRARGILTPGLLLRSGVGAACIVVPLAALHPGPRPADDFDDSPPGQLIGPPPSANARAAGALPAVDPPAATEESDRLGPPRREETVRPVKRPAAAPVRRAADIRDGVLVVQAPVIHAVLEREGSAVVWSPGEARPRAPAPPADESRESSECKESKSPAAQAEDPALAWIPANEATP